MTTRLFRILAISSVLLATPIKTLAAEGTVTFEMLKPVTALTAAQAALERCRDEGFQATIAVVDRLAACRSSCGTNLRARARFVRLSAKPERLSGSEPTPLNWFP